MNWLEYAESIGVLGALGTGLWQLRQNNAGNRRRDEDARTERSLKLHHDIVAEGATHEAFHELSVWLREHGTERFGATTWYLLSDDDFAANGLMVRRGNEDRHFRHVYTVLWFFERTEIALSHGLVNQEVLLESIGYHIWWWDELFRELKHPKARSSLSRLADKARTWAVNEGVADNWHKGCLTDFNLQGPRTMRDESGQPAAPSPSAV